MNRNFAGVVEDVQKLSLDEKTELADLLESFLTEERRLEIYENGKQSRAESEAGRLKFSSSTNELKAMLND
ncbi:MAG: hypothetical protein ACR2IA_11415 [Pyrinomonadaceae bacterium]